MKKFKSWGQLQTVLTVAEHGSYRAAAAALGVTSSTVARHIDAISQELDHPLFLPHGNKWELSELGREIVEIAEGAQTNISFVLKGLENQQDLAGSLQINTLSFVNSDFLAPALHLWQKKHPNAQLFIDASDQTTAVERGEADVALRLTRPDTPGITRFKLANCIVGPYTTGADRREWVGLPIDYDDLPEMRLARAHYGKPPRVRLDSFRAIAKAAVTTGLDCIMPTCMAREFPELSPVGVEGGELFADRELWFLFYETRKNDPAIKAARAWVKEIFPSPTKCLCGKCF